MIKKIKQILLVVAVTVVSQTAFSQCGAFSKNKCLPKLKPYIPTEQMHTTTMLTGERISVRMTFYYGDDNRILICADEALGKIQLNLKNSSNKVVFTTKSYGTIQWDFNVENTQDMTLEIITSDAPAGETFDKSGCVTVYVGFR